MCRFIAVNCLIHWLVVDSCESGLVCVQVEKHREELQHKHAREMEKLRDASVRLKEEYEHKIELEKLIFSSVTHFCL